MAVFLSLQFQSRIRLKDNRILKDRMHLFKVLYDADIIKKLIQATGDLKLDERYRNCHQSGESKWTLNHFLQAIVTQRY